MSRQVINVGTLANDGTGDTLRAGANKINDNFAETYAAINAPYIAGRRYVAESKTISTSSTSIADRFWFTPFIPRATATINKLGAKVAGASTGGTFKIAIYASSAAGFPTGTALAYTPDLSSTVGNTFVEGTLNTDYTVEAGNLYYFCFVSSVSTGTFSSYNDSFLQTQATAGVYTNVDPVLTAINGYYLNGAYATWPTHNGTDLATANSGTRHTVIAFTPI